MKMAVLSDTRLPTARSFAGHGLGQVCLTIAEGLEARGHEVHLWGAPGSSSICSGTEKWTDETEWNGRTVDFDVILDSTHEHHLQQRKPGAKIVNLSQDREAPPGRCAVYSSAAHRDWHEAHGQKRGGRVVNNGIAIPPLLPTNPAYDYYLYLATFYPPKGPVGALNAARLAGVRLVMAGPTAPGITPPTGAEYIGPVAGRDKFDLLRSAKALIFPSAIECSPVTVLEALSVGTPVICSSYGGASANMQHGTTGYACRDTLECVAAIQKIEALDPVAYQRLRAQCVMWVGQERSVKAMIDGYEQALKDCAEGQVW